MIYTRTSCCTKLSLGGVTMILLDPRDPLLHSERTQGFAADPVYRRAKCLPMLGEIKPKGPKGRVRC